MRHSAWGEHRKHAPVNKAEIQIETDLQMAAVHAMKQLLHKRSADTVRLRSDKLRVPCHTLTNSAAVHVELKVASKPCSKSVLSGPSEGGA